MVLHAPKQLYHSGGMDIPWHFLHQVHDTLGRKRQVREPSTLIHEPSANTCHQIVLALALDDEDGDVVDRENKISNAQHSNFDPG